MPGGETKADTPPFAEIDVLWITAGLGCDGDTISITAATQPSLEDILMGGLPWIPNCKSPLCSGQCSSNRQEVTGHRKSVLLGAPNVVELLRNG
jgi:hypothetical protein